MSKKVDQDAKIKEKKVILDARTDQLKEALAAKQGKTPSPYDIE